MKNSPLGRYLIPPVRGDYSRTQKARILHVSLLATAFAAIPIGILNISQGAGSFAIVLFVTAGFSLFGVFLNHRGYYRPAAIFLSLLIFIAIIYTIIDGAALNDPGVVALPLFILLMSLFFEKKAIIAATCFSIVTLVLLYILYAYGTLNLAYPPRISRVVILSILLTITGVLTWTISDLWEKILTNLTNRELELDTIFRSTPVGLGVVHKGVLTYVNEALCKIVGYTPDELIGRNVRRFYPDQEEYVRSRDKYEEILKTGPGEIESKVQRKDGVILDVLLTSRPIDQADSSGEVTFTVRDITEQRTAELALRDSETRYRMLFEQSSDATFTIEGDTFIDCNASALKIYAATRNQIIGKTPFDLSPPRQPDGRDSRDKALEYVNRALREGPLRFEWQHIRQDGTLFNADVSLNKIDLEGKEILLGIIRDLTERKQAELVAQEERQRLARDLHDAVSQTLWSASLIADVLPDLWEQDVEKGRDRLQRLRQLTRGALAEMRALLIELRPHSLVETPLDELLQRLREAIASRTGVEVILEIDGECNLEPDVHVGFYRIAQEALNNVVRHAVASKIEVRLQCKPDHVRLIVSDDGRGFDPSSPLSGQHLGMGIMRERAATIGARLDVESQPEKGTRIEAI